MNEFDTMISQRTLADKTKTNYRNAYDRFIKLNGKPVSSSTDEEIIASIDNADLKSNSKITLLIPITNIVASLGRDTIKMKEYRDELNKQQTASNAVRAKTNTLPTGADIIKYTDNLFTGGKYRDFIINYLLITYGVRNQDLNVIITKDKAMIDDKFNYLFD